MNNLIIGVMISTTLLLGACGGSSGDNDVPASTANTDANDTAGTDNTGTTDNTDTTDNTGATDNTDGSDNTGTTSGEPGSTSQIAGLWDITDFDTEFGEDIFYIEIFDDGSTISYDYQQDEFDDGDNCYIIERDLTLTPIGGDQYRSDTTGFPEDTEILTITRNNNVLTVSYIDVEDENNNGNTTETLTFNYPLLTGVDPVFNECV